MKLKEVLVIIIFLLVFILLGFWWMDRAEKIDAGEMIIVSESEMR